MMSRIAAIETTTREKAEWAHPIVNHHHYQVASGGELVSVVPCAYAADKRSAMNPNHHRKSAARTFRSIDVEIEAVLGALHARVSKLHLWACAAGARGVEDTRPVRMRLRRP